ncbi:MAG: OadG family protein [Lachnospiraceae bacterium]|nr:OadG family protein [Lachnospiraceae bacterium]
MKKLLAILGMITCMIGLTACGSSGETMDPNEETMAVESGEMTVNSIQQIVAMGGEEQYAELDEVVYNALLGFKSAMTDIGNYLGTDGGTATISGDEMIVEINVLGSEHNAVVEIVFDRTTVSCTGITTNVTYSMGEIMEKAALNTLLGMGTVFVVLILISLIISAFGLLPKLFTKKKAAAEEETAVKTDNVVAQIAEKEELSDDLELVAVISAAIAAYEGSGSTDGFVVRSIRKAYR